MNINGREIGGSNPPYVVAEISCEHKGKLINALRLIEVSKKAGADAVKFQIYDPIKLAMMRGGLDKVLEDGPWKGLTLEKLYTQTYTPRDWLPELIDFCNQEPAITWFTSVFHEEDLPYLESLGCPAYKIASPEIHKKKLINSCIETEKPIIVSTGYAGPSDIESLIRKTYNFIVLHCISIYPCPLEKAELLRINELKEQCYRVDLFDKVGYSDHTQGIIAPVAATALGAVMIEKHITLSKESGGWDRSFSLEPTEFMLMIDAIKNAHKTLIGEENNGTKDADADE